MVTGPDGRWVRRFHPCRDDAPRLACFPHAGGSASFFFPLSAALAPDVEVLGVQYPGRQDRRGEPGIDTIEGLAEGAHRALARCADRPLALFGHSMGAVICYEVARRLEEGPGPAPARLFVSGRRAPSTDRPERVDLSDDAAILAELGRLHGTDLSLFADPEVREMIMPAVRGDYRAVERYRWRACAPLRAPVTVLVGDADPHTTVPEARAWAAHTTGDLDLRVFSGGHFYLNDLPDELTTALRTGLLAPR